MWVEGLMGSEGNDERGKGPPGPHALDDLLRPPSEKLLSAIASTSHSVLIVLSSAAALDGKEAGKRMIDKVRPIRSKP